MNRIFLTLFLFFLSTQVQASSFLPKTMTWEEMASRAGLIFQGRFLSASQEINEHGLKVEVLRFKVKADGCFKGPCQDGLVSVSQVAGAHWSISLKQDQKYLLFFYPENEVGLTSIVGAGQGLLELKKRQGEWFVKTNKLDADLGVAASVETKEIQDSKQNTKTEGRVKYQRVKEKLKNILKN